MKKEVGQDSLECCQEGTKHGNEEAKGGIVIIAICSKPNVNQPEAY